MIRRATKDMVEAQISAGIDIPTDGEVPRENYIHYHCRHLNGIDFNRLTERWARAGDYSTRVPTFTGPVSLKHDLILGCFDIGKSRIRERRFDPGTAVESSGTH